MIRHIWCVACSRSIIDKETNNITLAEVLEQIGAEATVPRSAVQGSEAVLPIEFEIVSLWVREVPDQPARGVARIALQPPGGQSRVLGHEFDIDLTEYERLRTRSRFSGLPVAESGRYWFIVESREGDRDWAEVARMPMQINLEFPEDTSGT